MKKNPHAQAPGIAVIALKNFSAELERMSDASTLGHEQPNYYLHNRLWRSFMAGFNAAEAHYKHILERRRKR